MIKNVIFDVGGVLVDWDPYLALPALKIDREEFERVLDATVRDPVWREVDRSAVSDEALLERMVANAPSCEKGIAAYWDQVELTIRQRPYAAGWIRALRAEGYQVYILSNYARRTYERTRKELTFTEEASGALFSYEVRQVKPEPEIFASLLARCPSIRPEESVFLDDSAVNIEAARRFGFHGIVFRHLAQAMVFEDPGQAKAALADYGVTFAP